MTTIGVLALQGDFAEHVSILNQCGANAVQIRRASTLEHVEGLIIPGGESTAIAKLTLDNSDGIFDAIKQRALSGMPVYGTCMGAIFLAKEIEGSNQGRLALMDIKVRRNAFGSQKHSFEQLLDISCLGFNTNRLLAVFIRAPIILSCHPTVDVLAWTGDGIVMARQNNLLVSAFHPELTGDTTVHKYFLSMVNQWQQSMSNASSSRVSHSVNVAKSNELVAPLAESNSYVNFATP